MNRLCHLILLDQANGVGLDLEASEMSVRTSMHKVGATLLEKLVNADDGGHCGVLCGRAG